MGSSLPSGSNWPRRILPQDFPHRYLALYEVESDDLGKVAQALSEAGPSGAMFISESLDRTDAIARYFTPITDRRTAD